MLIYLWLKAFIILTEFKNETIIYTSKRNETNLTKNLPNKKVGYLNIHSKGIFLTKNMFLRKCRIHPTQFFNRFSANII